MRIHSLAYIAFLQLNKSAECYPLDHRAHESTYRLEHLYAEYNKHQKAYIEKQTDCLQDSNLDDEDLASSQELTQMMSNLNF